MVQLYQRTACASSLASTSWWRHQGGGDDKLSGYRRYQWHCHEERVRQRPPPFLRHNMVGILGGVYPKIDWAPIMLRAKSTFEALARDGVEGYPHSVLFVNAATRRKIFSQQPRRDLQGYGAIEVFCRHQSNAFTDHPLSLVQYLDINTCLPGDILTKVNRVA